MTENKEDNIYIYGRNAVIEAINAKQNIQKIFICFGTDNKNIIINAKRNKINCTVLDKSKFKELEKKITYNIIDNSNTNNIRTQGVIALKQLIEPVDLIEFISDLDLKTNPVIAILDGINDPHNLGAIARSAECAGVKAIILPNRNSAPITPVAIKTSAGALNYLPVIQITNLIIAIEKLKEYGFWIVGTKMDAIENYNDNIYDKPVAIIIGSEGKGISNAVCKHCDHLIKIPMKGNINSLNASVSAGIIFFEILRQHTQK